MKYGRLLRALSVLLTLCLGLLAAGPASSSPGISTRAARTNQIGVPGLGAHGNTAGSAAVPDRWLSSPRPAAPTTAVAGSRWYTYANGDDILAMAMEGPILWAGTRAGGVVRWDTRDGSFVQYLKPQDRLAGNTVRDIYIDAHGHKWFATDEGLSVLDDNGTPDKADDVWYTFAYRPIGSYFPSNRITAVAMDEAGYLWIGTSQYWDTKAEAYVGGGLVKMDTKGTLSPADDEWLQTYTVENTISRSADEEILGLASDNITDILPVPGNRVWVATQRHWAFRQFDSGDGANEGHWLLIYGGLSRLDHAGTPEVEDDTWQTWTCEAGSQYSPDVSCTINQLQLDANGYVWAAQRGRGVIAFPYDADRTLESVQFDKSDGLPANDIQSITFGPPDAPEWQNTVWLGAYDAASGTGHGVAVLDHKGTVSEKADDIWNEEAPVPGESITTGSGLPGDRVRAMVTGRGKIWMGIGGLFGEVYGISAFDLSRQVLQLPLTTASSGLPYNYIADLAIGRPGTRWENQVWIATGNERQRKYGAGALLLNTQRTPDPADDTWTQFTKEDTDDDGQPPWTGLASNNVTAIAIDGDYVWFGTQSATWDAGRNEWTDGGLSMYDGERWTIRAVENTGGERSGLRSNAISALAIGCQGKVWIALGNRRDKSGAGIDILDPMGTPHDLTNDHWWDPIVYPTIPSNLVTGFAPDCARGYMWVATAAYFAGDGVHGGGVARYDYATGAWTWWTTDRGIESYAGDGVSGQVGSIAVGPDGTVWAGGWGTRELSRQELIGNWPYVPATVNWFRNDYWSNRVFPGDGWISSIAVDKNQTVWAGTSRGGIDFDTDGKPDDSLVGRAIGGIQHTVDGTQWGVWTIENSPLATNDIEVIKVGPDGSVWAGTNGWGIMRFLDPLPVIRFTAELASSATEFGVGETSEVQVTLHNNSAEASISALRFRLHIEQDPSAPVFEPADPPLVSQPIVVEPGDSVSATFTLRAVRAGSVTLDVDVIGEVGTESDTSQYTTSIPAHPVTIVVGRKFYLPLIVAQAEMQGR